MTRFSIKMNNKQVRQNQVFSMVVIILTLTSCQINVSTKANHGVLTNSVTEAQRGTAPEDQTPDKGETSDSPEGVNTQTTSAVENTSLPSSPISTTTGSLALEKFKESRASVMSEQMTHLWSVESNFPLKTGQIMRALNYDAEGEISTGWGSSEESEGVNTIKKAWYRTTEELVLDEAGEFKRYPLSQIRVGMDYDFAGLMETMLSEYSVSRETGSFYVKLTTQSEMLIEKLMQYLGYRKSDAEAYQGNLYLEASLDEVTGNLLQINYLFKQRVAGYSDNGSITFKDWNMPVAVEIPMVPETIPVSQP